MKEKLIDLLTDNLDRCDNPLQRCSDEQVERLAEHLIQNGVIVPPCKVGDTVWRVEDVWHLDDKETWTYHYEKEVLEFMVRSISVSCNSKGVWTYKLRICQMQNGKTIDKQRNIDFRDVGMTIFLTKEEAEKALKGAENGDV